MKETVRGSRKENEEREVCRGDSLESTVVGIVACASVAAAFVIVYVVG